MQSKRELLRFAALGAVLPLAVACGTSTGNNATVPTIAQAQAWVSVLKTELPVFIQESINSGLVKTSTGLTNGITAFTQLATQFTSPTFDVSTTTAVLGQLSVALGTVLTFIPGTAPYVALVQLGLTVITALIAATPIVVPATPSSTKLASLHTATVKFHK